MAEGEGNVAADQPDVGKLKERLIDLSARATALYAVKKYEEAAEIYSEATQLQAEVNGEMSEENADLLFTYGRCLFYVAQKTSTVLGGTAASAQLKGSDKKPSTKRKTNGTPRRQTHTATESSALPETIQTAEPVDVVPAADIEPEKTQPSNALFKIEGDAADWADSDDEDGVDDEEGDAEDGDEEDDFATAFEILDIARILYLRRLDVLATGANESAVRDLRVRISDIYDLQAEISLEGEKFSVAVADLKSCLELKEMLYSQDNSILAECHYKLSLALEAASQDQQRDGDGNPVGNIVVDWKLRDEAVIQQEEAIKSCLLRIDKEKAELGGLADDKKARAQEQIDDVQDMTNAMEQRLEELKKPPISVKAEADKDAQNELMGSVLGSLLGGTSDEQKGKLAEIVAGANDLSGMVKKKKKSTSQPSAVTGNGASKSTETKANGNGKRKLVEPELIHDGSKKVRIEDVVDEGR